MILGASFEFSKTHNNEISSRPSDNEEVPQVGRLLAFSHFTHILNLDKILTLNLEDRVDEVKESICLTYSSKLGNVSLVTCI